MFGSTNPFGQLPNSPFGSPSVFGQTSSATPNPFSSQSGSPIFGGTSTGVFGQTSSPLASTPTFGASSAPAFGSSTPAFGASSTPAFGSSSSAFGGSSMFGQKPSFGGFGSTPSQASPFGSTFQQAQPAYGNNVFSSTPFGASSQPAFGATSTPVFGSTSTPAFGATTTPSPSFGASTTPAFGSTPLFGGTGTGFGVSITPAFGSSVASAFGAPSTSLFGSSSTPTFGASSTPAFGSASTPAFSSSSTPSFGFGSTPSFSQSTSTFGSTPFGTTSSPFGSQSFPFGAQSTTPTFGSPGFGQSTFGGPPGGSRVAPYNPTPEADGGNATQPAGKLESVSSMSVYKDKSHEELRWEDYQCGDKGGPNPSGQPAGGITFPASTQANPFGSTSTFGQPSTNPFSSSTSSNLFATKPSTFGSSSFGSSSTSIFNSPFSSSLTSPFGSSTTTPVFGASTTSGFVLSTAPLIFGGAAASASSSSFGSSLTFGNTQSSGLFQSSTPSFGQTPSLFGQPSTGFQNTTLGFGSNPFSTPSTGFGNLFSNSTPSILPTSNPVGFGQTNPSLSTAFQMATTPQNTSAFTFSTFGQTQPATSGGFGSIFNHGTAGQFGVTQSIMVTQPAPITNPFGMIPTMPQMSIGHVGPSPSVQYGISSMPVAEKPNPVRISSLLTPRHLSQRKIRLPARKYHPKSEGQRLPFFTDDGAASTPKADALFIPRGNPRALIIRSIEQWPSRTTGEKLFNLDDTYPANGNGNVSGSCGKGKQYFRDCIKTSQLEIKVEHIVSFALNLEGPAENGHNREYCSAPLSQSEPTQKLTGAHTDQGEKGMDSSYIKISGHRAGKAAIVYEHGADIEALMPKLYHTDYYTEPRIQELVAKERCELGYCCHVKDFVVGRQGYGSIKFSGETDVRRLDLESIIQFNNREVIVYKDESKKPPVGQGLNKPAEVTLLNIKCMSKNTGQQYTEIPKVEKYKEMLMKKAAEQGAEYVLYDPVKGEWKFKVEHFSRYGFGDGGPEVSDSDEFGDGIQDVLLSYELGGGGSLAFRS